MLRTYLLVSFLFLQKLTIHAQSESSIVHFTILDDGSAIPVHCNIRIRNAEGQSLYPDSSYFWRAFMGTTFPDYPTDGKFSIQLPPGKYSYEADRGPEYFITAGNIDVAQKEMNIVLQLKRIADLKKRKWWSGELHVHRKVKDMEHLMKCSDLHVVPGITSWNSNVKPDVAYDGPPKQFDNDRFYTTTGSEDERSGGAILVINTPHSLDFSKDMAPEYPPLAASVQRAAAAFPNDFWIDIDKPYWWDVPVLLATGNIHSVGIANNHMNQGGVFDGEAWGRARDTAKYPSPMGNGYYAQDVYYHMVNAGINIAPSAGSASGVLMNPVGYNRIYAYVPGALTYQNWFQSVKEQKIFITNGPLLVCKANDKYPGHVFTSSKKIKLHINAEIWSRDTIDVIEIVKNGKVYSTISASELKKNKYRTNISFDRSGWFLMRVICKTSGNFRFASTAPYQVVINDKKYISRSSAQYFLDWVNKRAGMIKVNDAKRSAEIMQYIDAAKNYWQILVDTATDE